MPGMQWIPASILAATVAALTLPHSAAAFDEDPIYLYGDVEYLVRDPDTGSTLTGVRLSGSYPISDEFHVTGFYSRVDNGGLTARDFGAALGYRYPVVDGTHLVGRIGMARARINPAGAPALGESALVLQLGIRSMVNWNLELNGFITHRDFDDSDTRLDVGGVYVLTERIGITAGVSFGSDDTTFSFGARLMMP
jgi:hypothetical protein